MSNDNKNLQIKIVYTIEIHIKKTIYGKNVEIYLIKICLN
jgi:hypothetical protein